MALTDKLTDIADAIREVGGTTAKLTPAEMPDAIAKLGESEGSLLSMSPGQPFTLTCDLRDAGGAAYEMTSSDTLKLHMWHGADTLDAESATATIGVDVPREAVCRLWHWYVDIYTDGATRRLVCYGDAQCMSGAKGTHRVGGVVDSARVWGSALYGAQIAMDYSYEAASDYYLQTRPARVIRAPQLTSVARYVFMSCQNVAALELPKLATEGGNSNFSSSIACRSAEFPELTSLGYAAFQNSQVQCIEAPACTNIGQAAFNYCTRLKVIALGGQTMCTLSSSGILRHSPHYVSGGVGRIYVNDSLVNDYKAATNWSAFASYIKPISEWDGTIPKSYLDVCGD